MHIYHVASGTPVATILRPARTPKGTEVRTVIKHVTKHLRRHWPTSDLVRGRPIWFGGEDRSEASMSRSKIGGLPPGCHADHALRKLADLPNLLAEP